MAGPVVKSWTLTSLSPAHVIATRSPARSKVQSILISTQIKMVASVSHQSSARACSESCDRIPALLLHDVVYRPHMPMQRWQGLRIQAKTMVLVYLNGSLPTFNAVMQSAYVLQGNHFAILLIAERATHSCCLITQQVACAGMCEHLWPACTWCRRCWQSGRSSERHEVFSAPHPTPPSACHPTRSGACRLQECIFDVINLLP